MNSKSWMNTALATIAALSLATGALAATQGSFATAQEAADALAVAAKKDDVNALRAILGTKPGELSSGDAVADRALRKQFSDDYEAKHALVESGDTTKLTIGSNDFPFAFPIVKSGGKWHFDTQAGIDELNARRIGENELTTIKVLLAIADAEQEYASQDRNGDGVLEYARRFVSSPGKKDGLYWPTKEGEPPSPLGALVARASSEGYKSNKTGPTALHGYYYRMLKGQAKTANGGALDYVVHGRAIGGFGVVAYPAKYGSSGIMTFIVNQDGKVYQSDLGPKTAERANAITRFDPGKGWTETAAQ